jgi:hypothetical protein
MTDSFQQAEKSHFTFSEIHYSERLKRMRRAHGNIYFEYQLSTADIRNEELFNIYAYKYPDPVRKKLMTFCRVKLSKKDITKEHRKKISLASRKHYYHIK